jgi:hypothetical protein
MSLQTETATRRDRVNHHCTGYIDRRTDMPSTLDATRMRRIMHPSAGLGAEIETTYLQQNIAKLTADIFLDGTMQRTRGCYAPLLNPLLNRVRTCITLYS